MELPSKIGDVLFIPVGNVASGADLELLLGDLNALLEGDLRTLLRLERSSWEGIDNKESFVRRSRDVGDHFSTEFIVLRQL